MYQIKKHEYVKRKGTFNFLPTCNQKKKSCSNRNVILTNLLSLIAAEKSIMERERKKK